MTGRQEYIQRHYDGVQTTSAAERAKGPLFLLKKYHNSVKRQLLSAYASRADALLDLCCGRGGDLQKWASCGIRHVTGVDISDGELAEARRRAAELRGPMTCTFLQADAGSFKSSMTYDAVSAMFCLHYFFQTERSLRSFLEVAASSLRPGGYFIGCCPDGKKIQECIQSGRRVPYLELCPLRGFQESWPFGREYSFALQDTVTASVQSAGSLEYLVDFDVLTSLAAEYGLERVEVVPFSPPTPYPGAEASALFASFVFRKV